MKRKELDANDTKAESEDERITVEVSRDESTMLTEDHVERELLSDQDTVVCGTRSKSHTTPLKNANLILSSPEIYEDVAGKEDGVGEFKGVRCNVVQRTSARVLKRLKKENTGGASSEPQQIGLSKKTGCKQNPQPEQLRTRRSWELWSVEDKNNFFEALCEYGKDFENIQSFIAQRSRKKGILPNMIKNKDQVRHFYYRTWHKISKYLNISDEVKKQTQELYGLINYAELRKKIGGCLNDKNRQQLNELVFHGVTTVKFRGKKLRIKTPICRALKKLNSVEDSKEPDSPKLPKEIYVEFRPKTNAAWLYVQNLSQNPRLRTKVNLQRRISTIITYLEKRWKPLWLHKKEQIAGNLIQPSFEHSLLDSVPSLRLRPCYDANVSLLSLSSVDSTPFANVCLEKHVKNLHVEQKDKDCCKMKKMNRKCKGKCATVDCDEHSEVTEKSSCDNEVRNCQENSDDVVHNSEILSKTFSSGRNVKSIEMSSNPEEEAKRSLSLLKNILQSIDSEHCSHTSDSEKLSESESNQNSECLLEDCNEPGEEKEEQGMEKSDVGGSVDVYLTSQTENVSMTLGQLLSLSSKTDKKCETEDKNLCIESLESKGDEMKPVNEEKLKILKGWTLASVGLMTVGELYLMLKCPDKLVLEYDFESPPKHTEEGNTSKELHARSQMELIGLVLKKLIAVATSYFSDFKSKQTPLSPTNRNTNICQNRAVATPPAKLSVGRSLGRSPGVKTARPQVETKNPENSSEQEDFSNTLESVIQESAVVSQTPNETQVPVPASSKDNSDQHVFVVPVRAAPRNVKSSSIRDSGQEGVELMSSRRNQRQKRKPIVVKRALLPRSSTIGTRPMGAMTVVHLLPSPSPVATVIPSVSPSTAVQKMVLPPAKKIMKVLPTVSTSTVDVRSLQIPLLKPVTSGNAIFLPPNALPTSQIVDATPGMVNSVQSLNTSLFPLERKSDPIVAVPSNPVTSASTELSVITTSSSTVINSSSSTTEISNVGNICITASSGTSPPRISIPDSTSSSNLSSPNISSFLEISLPEAIPAKTMANSTTERLLDFNDNSNSSLSAAFGLSPSKEQLRNRSNCLSVDPMVSDRQGTPPQSPGNRFKVNSPGPEAQWLNGESADFSLNSLLNTFESPCKNSVHTSGDGSSLDSISRLAPDVDTHLQCLINENSVDYVAKFADLAAQIASNSSENKCS